MQQFLNNSFSRLFILEIKLFSKKKNLHRESWEFIYYHVEFEYVYAKGGIRWLGIAEHYPLEFKLMVLGLFA